MASAHEQWEAAWDRVAQLPDGPDKDTLKGQLSDASEMIEEGQAMRDGLALVRQVNVAVTRLIENGQ